LIKTLWGDENKTRPIKLTTASQGFTCEEGQGGAPFLIGVPRGRPVERPIDREIQKERPVKKGGPTEMPPNKEARRPIKVEKEHGMDVQKDQAKKTES